MSVYGGTGLHRNTDRTPANSVTNNQLPTPMSQSTTEIPVRVPDTIDVSTSDCCQILASKRRRLVLSILADRSSPVELSSLARELAEKMGTTNSYTDTTVDSLAVQLHHIHLPMMDEVEAIEYHSAETVVKHVEHSQ